MTNDDYPAEALRAKQEGTTKISLRISRKGKATTCSIVESSGVESLDSASCRIFSKRKFRPAKDAGGRAIEADLVTTMRWTLP